MCPDERREISAMKTKITCIIGTRPEAIKMAPVIQTLRRENFEVIVLSTGQHRTMLAQALSFFGIAADHDLEVMEERQTLDGITSRVLAGVGEYLDSHSTDLVLVHGDTTTTMASALASFYRHIPVGHIEAGLRSLDMERPFPEEANRIITDRLSSLWFAPTAGAAENLRREGFSLTEETLFITGNTVIDALQQTVAKNYPPSEPLKSFFEIPGPVILLTAHRRESWGDPLRSVCRAAGDLLDACGKIRILIPMHKNPSVREILTEHFAEEERVLLCEPLDYPDFVSAMNRSTLILSDSGGVQEEAAFLKKIVLVLRDISERPEALDTGTALLVGTSREKIAEEALRVLSDMDYRKAILTRGENPFGDGRASSRIADGIRNFFRNR